MRYHVTEHERFPTLAVDDMRWTQWAERGETFPDWLLAEMVELSDELVERLAAVHRELREVETEIWAIVNLQVEVEG